MIIDDGFFDEYFVGLLNAVLSKKYEVPLGSQAMLRRHPSAQAGLPGLARVRVVVEGRGRVRGECIDAVVIPAAGCRVVVL